MERYRKRWNLRLNGLKGKQDENTRELTVDLLKIVPHWKDKIDWILDTVHRRGKSTDHPRQIIMQFTARIYRDELWRVTKGHPICMDLNLRFAEGVVGVPTLTLTDRE
ncbi:hypothetical protein CRENBAI_026583 [Crenichthys baileyi]|uniref:Uncharacterized protein n=1 Tax=Crenichthys baileyi TaxID=28760 RepID=A0AAV9S381_9TELE